MNPSELLRDLQSLQGLYERTLSAVMRLPMTAPTDDLGLVIARALVEAAELGAADPAAQTVRHTHEPRATEVDVDVAVTTTGRTLAVKVGRAAQPGETDHEAARAAANLSLFTTQHTIALYAEQGMAFGKDQKVGA